MTLASDLVAASRRSAFAADSAAAKVHSLIHSTARLIASARRLPVVAPFTMPTVNPSIPSPASGSAHQRHTLGSPPRLPRRLLHAGQAGVDALDRGVRFGGVHLDDEFELVVVFRHSDR